MDEYPQKIDWSCPPVRALGSSFCPTEWPSGECGHVFWVHSAVQQNKVRATGGGGGGTCCQCATKKIYKICFSPKDTSPKCLFLLNTDFIISDGNCDSLRRQTILLSNTIDLTRAQICFSVSQERATLCIRGRLHNWRNKGYISRKARYFLTTVPIAICKNVQVVYSHRHMSWSAG